MCVSRYPELSPDFVNENGKQVRKQEGVDPDIQIVFHDAAVTQAWVVENEKGELTLMVRTPDGKATSQPLGEKAASLPMAGSGTVQIRLAERTANAVPVMVPEIVPPENRPRGQNGDGGDAVVGD